MSTPWLILTTRYGTDSTQPSAAQLRQAIDELFEEKTKGLTDSDYAEHPNAWLRSGTDGGPMFVIDAYRTGTVILSKFADQDDDEPSQEATLSNMSREKILKLWTSLAIGDLRSIQLECPGCGGWHRE